LMPSSAMGESNSMDLAEHQRKLLSMIKGTYHASERDDPYLQAVDGSEHLEMVREIATWWRIFDLERYCILTARLLKQRGEYEASVDRFVKTHTISPFINELSEAFLKDLGGAEDRLLGEVALFELALTRVKRGDPSTYTLDWEHDPVAVLTGIVKGIDFEEDETSGTFRVTVSANLPGMFSVSQIDG
jgi:hypothetical protein